MSQTVLFQGDVPPAVQRQIIEFSDFHLKGVSFARTTGQKLVLKEASVFKRAEDRKLHSKLVYEINVGEGSLIYARCHVPSPKLILVRSSLFARPIPTTGNVSRESIMR